MQCAIQGNTEMLNVKKITESKFEYIIALIITFNDSSNYLHLGTFNFHLDLLTNKITLKKFWVI